MKKTMPLCLTWISVLCWVLAGCSTDKDMLLPHGEQTMLDIWNGAGSQGTQQQLLEARQQLRRPLAPADFSASLQEPYTRTAANEIRNLFPRLPNPDLVLYVYPHLSGTELAPVPGYSTVFPFYQRVQYALPGERQEDL
ncbi:conjugal transfer protein [Pseudomonas sp. UMC65]|uniref:TIGR03751 family conjugal transfer lipoprotein n=1 Tax=unclassified Pseudomonas TaxID=196821 RepID=UPI0016039C7B|nr:MULTISPECIES: TIGR03751 family conjugal transfer lipoprotein [unclassified Pseudomonas]MBB1612526.1 conjugal transfer protein [Pseudomonas sp. UMC65]MBB1622774.1 conjugal transfer protein [Pseudomonas sp. UME65]